MRKFFVPPSLKGKGDTGKGSIPRNLPKIPTRIPRLGPRLTRNLFVCYNERRICAASAYYDPPGKNDLLVSVHTCERSVDL